MRLKMPRDHFTNCIIYVDSLPANPNSSKLVTLLWRYTFPILYTAADWLEMKESKTACAPNRKCATSRDEKDDDDAESVCASGDDGGDAVARRGPTGRDQWWKCVGVVEQPQNFEYQSHHITDNSQKWNGSKTRWHRSANNEIIATD